MSEFKELKNNLNDGLYKLEKVIQSIGINEKQQEQLTSCLESFSEAIDFLIVEIEILDKYANRLDSLGETDAHTGEKTLENRLNMIEGMQEIFCSAHMGHTNYSEPEFIEMHGDISGVKFDAQIRGMQKKIDRITKLLENFEIKMSVADALKL
jgi:hypothetical protein